MSLLLLLSQQQATTPTGPNIPASVAYANPRLYPNKNVTGNVAELTATPLEAASNTKATTAANSGNVVRQMRPEATTATTVTIPAVGTAWNGIGWQATSDLIPNDAGVTRAATIACSVSLTASTANTVPLVVILYLSGVEIGRGTVSAAATTTATDFAVPVTVAAGQSIPAGARVQMAVYGTFPSQGLFGGTNTYTLNYGGGGTDVDPVLYSIRSARSTSDSLAVTALTSRLAAVLRAGSEPVAASDSTTRTSDAQRSTTDSSAGADSTSRTQQSLRTSSDSSTLADTASRTSATMRASADSTTSSDSTVRSIGLSRSTSDAATLVDSTTRSLSETRTTSDASAASDSTSRTDSTSRSATDTSSPTATAPRTSTTSRSISDSTSTADTTSRTQTARRPISDSTTLVDSTSRTPAATRTASDTTSPADSAARQVDTARSTSDATGTSDSARRTSIGSRSTTEALSATDSTTRTVSGSFTASDTVSADATADRSPASLRTATDSASLSDTASTSQVLARTSSDTTSTSDTAQTTHVALQTATVSASTLDTASRQAATSRLINDALATPVDSTTRAYMISRLTTDTTPDATISAFPTPVYRRTASQNMNPSDEPLVNPTLTIKGFVRTRGGLPYLDGAQVRLLRDDGVVVASMISNPDGSYEFLRNAGDPHTYRVFAYDSASPTDQNITGVLAPLAR